jgi:hypothetical protein
MSHTCPITGKRVLRYEEIFASFDKERAISRDAGTERYMPQDVFDAAVRAIRSSIVDESVDLHLDLGCNQFAVSASRSCGQTFLYVINKHYADFTRPGALELQMVGPSSMLDCYREFAAGKRIDIDCRYVVEASEAFGADPHAVHGELIDFLANGNTPMAERIVLTLPIDPRIHVRGDWYEMVALSHKVAASPDLRRFCKNGIPDLEQAAELIDWDRQLAAREKVSRPTV